MKRAKEKLGKGFEIEAQNAKSKVQSHWADKREVSKEGWLKESLVEPRLVPFFALLVFGIGVLLVRLLWVTIIQGNYYRSMSEENRVREKVVWAPRGIIYDRERKALVLNRPVYRKLKTQNLRLKTYEYFSQEEVLELEAKGESGDIELFVSREYPFGKAFAHVIGYVGEVDEADVKEGLRLGSLVGKSGLEERFDSVLRGREGKILVEIDALGRKVKELGKVEAKAGENIVTTLDYNLQLKAKEAMQDKEGRILPGAVIVSKTNGEILVLYSSPSFDPNIFVVLDSFSESDAQNVRLSKILNDPNRPLFNRAISGLYPPGSVFKLVVAAAALEEGAIDKETMFEDKGFIAIGPYLFRNWYYTQYGKTEGEVDIVGAIARSVDTFFYKAGELTGIEKLAGWGKKFGIGKKLGIEIVGEKDGRMPDKEWKLAEKGERWYLGDTYHISIGQGDLLTTPLQINFATGVIANGGKLCRPKLISNKRSEGNNFSTECKDLGLEEETLKLIKEGMRKACEPGGTGFPFFKFKVDKRAIPVACKTGTAEFADPEGKTHAWFTVFAPSRDPEVVVTVLVEKGGSGAYVAAPVAKEILTAYFEFSP